MEPLMPFKYVIISPEDTSMKEGCIISEFNQCGLFLCQKGQAEILLGGRPYQINKRNLFIYTAANLLQIRQRSADLEGIMIEVDLDYVIPIVNKVANSLFAGKSLSVAFRRAIYICRELAQICRKTN